ncbi:hypothetical protein N8150_03350 [Gammaproteobacteria bacterium]|nr:hypothetical protein [Gammaproteobacteria bacterium]
MPVDEHPEHKVSGVELILCKLHAGAKFSGDDYNFPGRAGPLKVFFLSTILETFALVCADIIASSAIRSPSSV